ncbi:MAG: bifunctional folylpolyglutamate synthase/dihydrofolate synthase [Spirochaetes bacterium]|nr:MAG: bifunctional folylpolyglutamate synthase/dihydrofolate synthase [Spirochaetota bacterium]RKX97899.1 MAG: bifunctional folylpolyglutamate synthase/dihydrofolate synthase [Spirochaetota bacterium]
MNKLKNLDEAFSFFEARTNLEKGIPLGNPNRVYRLDRMKALCGAFGNPQESFRSIHLAGSKGKGSTAAYIAALLTSAGRRVGVYASPHLLNYRERFRIQGENFPETAGLSTAQMLIKKLPEIEGNLPGEGGATTFELLTLFAFLLFRDSGCDTAVLETGLGGRLDATNVISSPEAVVFTPIEREHTEILGNRLKDIAEEKAGIMKSVPYRGLAFSASQHFITRQVIKRKAAETGMKLLELPLSLHSITMGQTSDTEDRFSWQLSWKNGNQELISLSMGGRIQANNAALALMVVRELESGFCGGSKALTEVSLPGRFQFLQHHPAVVLDGAHTPRSVAALAEAFIRITAEDDDIRPILLFGSVEGKDHQSMARKLCGGSNPCFREVIISTPGTFKPSNPAVVAESFRKTGVDVTLIPEPEEAWEAAAERSQGVRPILITGSFFMAGEIAGLFTAKV